MVTQLLVAYPVTAGWRLLEQLDKRGAGVTVAYWYFSEDADQWLLAITGPSVPERGRLPLIQNIQEALSEISEDELQGMTLQDIRTPSPQWREVEEMRRRYGKSNGDFPRPGFGSHDPYIYRME